jgi:phosphatidylserine decarboxylase
VRLPIHREGWPYIAIAVAANSLIFAFFGWPGWVLLPLSLWVVAFFRDPERTPPPGDHLILSPADGKLLPVTQAAPPAELGLGEAPRTRLSIFMNVFNVHVNRNPATGMVAGLAYRPGKFFNASFDKASVDNERMSIRLELDGQTGRELVVVQIAGLVARRIKCDLKTGQRVLRGERFGIIRFGSRLDVYLPEGARVVARPGQTTRAGETVLAELPI